MKKPSIGHVGVNHFPRSVSSTTKHSFPGAKASTKPVIAAPVSGSIPTGIAPMIKTPVVATVAKAPTMLTKPTSGAVPTIGTKALKGII